MASHPTSFSFATRVGNASGGDTHYVMTQDGSGRDCWFLMKITPRNLARLKQTTKTDRIDLTQYGTVLESGWGHEIPQD